MRIRLLALSSALWLITAGPVHAQEPCPCPPATPPPPPVWTGAASLGFGLAAGNSETRTLNGAIDVTRDPKTKQVLKFSLLYLWSSDHGDDTANRLAFRGRDEYKLSDRAYAYGQLAYLRDPFKAIDYLVAPTGGIGYKIVDTEATKFSLDGGGGVTWEKNPDLDVRTYGAITFGEQVSHQLTKTAALAEGFNALWKADDFGDALYTFSAGIAAAISTRTAIKVDLLDTYKSKPPTSDVKKNDVALLVSFAYKF